MLQVKFLPITLIIGAAFSADRKAARKIAAVANGDKETVSGCETGWNPDRLASLRTKLGDETDRYMIVHNNTSFQEDCST